MSSTDRWRDKGQVAALKSITLRKLKGFWVVCLKLVMKHAVRGDMGLESLRV